MDMVWVCFGTPLMRSLCAMHSIPTGYGQRKMKSSFFIKKTYDFLHISIICRIFAPKSIPSRVMREAKTYLLAATCLMIGVLLYATCRTDIWFVQQLHLDLLPHTTMNTQNAFIYWLVFCLPDGLWYMALLILQQQLTQRESVLSRICMYAAVALPFLLEGMQAAGWLIGTFDYRDILTYLFTLILFLCLRKKLYSSDCKCWLSPSL